jgi:transcriptional regulator with XRE-family HTH domain
MPTKARRSGDAEGDQDHQPPEWSAEELGRKLRELRTERGLRLSDVAKESGLSVSFISHVEQGQSDISVGRLMRLAHALHVPLPDLVSLPAKRSVPLVRADERAMLPTPIEDVKMELLAESPTEGRTYAVSYLEPGSSIEARGRRPAGQDYFIYMLEGRAVIELSSRGPLALGQDDSVAFTSEEFQQLTNPTKQQTRLLWVSIVSEP